MVFTYHFCYIYIYKCMIADCCCASRLVTIAVDRHFIHRHGRCWRCSWVRDTVCPSVCVYVRVCFYVRVFPRVCVTSHMCVQVCIYACPSVLETKTHDISDRHSSKRVLITTANKRNRPHVRPLIVAIINTGAIAGAGVGNVLDPPYS